MPSMTATKENGGPMFHVTITRAITAFVIISAILVPAASARPIDPPGVGVATTQPNIVVPHGAATASGVTSPEAQPTTSHPALSTGARSSGFDWGDAALGAVGMLFVVSLSAVGVVTMRRSREHGQAALTS
jgi:hypothetical protein